MQRRYRSLTGRYASLVTKKPNYLRGDTSKRHGEHVPAKQPAESPAHRLGRLVAERRNFLGLSHVEVAGQGGPSVSSQQRIERGDIGTTMRPLTMNAVERGLKWAPGSVTAILAGGEPTPEGAQVEHFTDSQGQPVTVTIDLGTPLTAQERRELMAAAEAEVLKRWREIRGNS
jgi:hypothetical protein